MKGWKAISITVGIIFFIYSFWIEPNRMEINRISIKIKGLNDALNGLSIVHLSDLHLVNPGPARRGGVNIGKREAKLLKIVNELNPDILVITGDFVNKQEAVDDCIQLINEFKAKYGKWGVWGNYDYWLLDPTDREKLAESDIVILSNENQNIKIDQQNIWIMGVDCPFTGRDNLSQAIDGVPEEDFKILLAHSPAIIEEASRYRIDLVLAGHTHGGQIYIPLISHLIVYLLGGKRYIRGLYRMNQTYMYVTRGIGTSILPLRAFCPPEIVLIKLEKEKT